MRVTVRVQPGASKPGVGGRYGDGYPPVLVVRVSERAVEGKANEAVVKAVAEAFGARRSDVVIVTGTTSRTKVLDIEGAASERLEELLNDR